MFKANRLIASGEKQPPKSDKPKTGTGSGGGGKPPVPPKEPPKTN